MALMDEFKEERAAIKNAPLKTKISYVWRYYKWHIFIPLVIIIFLSWYIVHVITEPDMILNGIFLNTSNSEASAVCEELREDFFEGENINTKKYDIAFDPSLTYVDGTISGASNFETTQTLTSWIASGKTDFFISDWKTMTNLAYKSYLIDLREVLSEEEIEKYEPCFLYVDNAKCHNMYLDPSTALDCSKPEEMEEPVPVMIDVSGYKGLSKIYAKEQPFALGIALKSSHVDNVLKLLKYLE